MLQPCMCSAFRKLCDDEAAAPDLADAWCLEFATGCLHLGLCAQPAGGVLAVRAADAGAPDAHPGDGVAPLDAPPRQSPRPCSRQAPCCAWRCSSQIARCLADAHAEWSADQQQALPVLRTCRFGPGPATTLARTARVSRRPVLRAAVSPGADGNTARQPSLGAWSATFIMRAAGALGSNPAAGATPSAATAAPGTRRSVRQQAAFLAVHSVSSTQSTALAKTMLSAAYQRWRYASTEPDARLAAVVAFLPPRCSQQPPDVHRRSNTAGTPAAAGPHTAAAAHPGAALAGMFGRRGSLSRGLSRLHPRRWSLSSRSSSSGLPSSVRCRQPSCL